MSVSVVDHSVWSLIILVVACLFLATASAIVLYNEFKLRRKIKEAKESHHIM